MKNQKGQVIYYWLYALIAVFILGTFYVVFVPFFQVPFGETMRNITISTSNTGIDSSRALGVIDNTIKSVATGIVVLIILFLLFAFIVTQKREDQVNVYQGG